MYSTREEAEKVRQDWIVKINKSVKTRYTDGLLTNDEYTQASLWLESLKERMKGE